MNIEEYLNKNRYIYSGITDFVIAPVKDNGRTIFEYKFKTMPSCETCDIKTDCFLEQARHGKIWAMTNFCSLHQDFRGGHA